MHTPCQNPDCGHIDDSEHPAGHICPQPPNASEPKRRQCDGSCGGHQENLGTGCLADRADNTESSDPMQAMSQHQARIKPLWDAAFVKPVQHDYKLGDIVWLYDHYNTGRITGEGLHSPDAWRVETSDADGTVHQYEYPAEWLRPAAEAVEFRWPVTELGSMELYENSGNGKY